jgi:hypothetical protein
LYRVEYQLKRYDRRFTGMSELVSLPD